MTAEELKNAFQRIILEIIFSALCATIAMALFKYLGAPPVDAPLRIKIAGWLAVWALISLSTDDLLPIDDTIPRKINIPLAIITVIVVLKIGYGIDAIPNLLPGLTP